MSRKPVEIPIASDTRQFSKAVASGVIDPLEDAQKALEEVAREGDQAGDKLVDSMKAAQTATEKMNKTVADGTKTSFTKMSANVDHGTSKAKESMREVSNEAKANASETFSSFDGSAQSLADGVQGTFGGLIAGLSMINPALAGLAAGAAIAWGLVRGQMAKSDEKTEESRQKVSELTDAMIEAGGEGTVAFESVTDALKEMASETAEGEKNLKDIANQAQRAGHPFQDLADAFAGNAEALQRSIDLTKEQIRVDQGYIDANDSSTNRFKDNYERRIAANKELLTELEAVGKQYEDAAKNEQLYLDSGAPGYETKAGLIGSINDAYDEAAGAVDDFISTESGLFKVGAYIKAMEKRSEALKDYQANLIKADLPPEVINFLNEQGAEAASAMVQGYVDTSPKNREKLLKIWEQAAGEASGTIEKQVTAVVNKTYKGPSIKPTIDTRAYENGIKRLQLGFNVPITLTTRDGRKLL